MKQLLTQTFLCCLLSCYPLANADTTSITNTNIETDLPKTHSATTSVAVNIEHRTKKDADKAFQFKYPLKGGIFISAPKPLASIPHDPSHFTQGLLYHQGLLYESTGLYGKSKLVELNAETGQILRQRKVPAEYFAEGLALNEDKLYQLTWKQGKAFVYDRATFELIDTINYQGEGWGISFNKNIIHMTDGSNNIINITDINNFNIDKKITTNILNKTIKNLNEAEIINDYLWVNIWQTKNIAIINPLDGKVIHILNFDLPLNEDSYTGQDVLNGIAYNNKNGDIYITGKLFKKIYKYNIKQFI